MAVNVSTLTRVCLETASYFECKESLRKNYVLHHRVRYLRSCFFRFLLETSNWYYSHIQYYC